MNEKLVKIAVLLFAILFALALIAPAWMRVFLGGGNMLAIVLVVAGYIAFVLYVRHECKKAKKKEAKMMADQKLPPCEECAYRKYVAMVHDMHIWGEDCPKWKECRKKVDNG